MQALVNLDNKKAVITLTKEQIAEINRQQDPYLQACLILGETPRPALTDTSNKRLVHEDFAHRLVMCIEAKNAIKQEDGTYKVWQPVYDGNERHFYPRFVKDSSGSGWSFSVYGYWYTDTVVGPRLEYRTYDLMLEGVKEFKTYYEGYFNN